MPTSDACDRAGEFHAVRPSRRSLIQAGALGGAAWLWADWLRATTTVPPGSKARAKSIILIFNSGAPSHIDLWDPKPEAPDNIRGLFQPIDTNVPGIQVSELLPEAAKRADRLAIVRTVHHEHTQHNSGMYWSIVGRPYRVDNTLINPSRTDHPSVGTLVGWLAQRDGLCGAMPPYVITPWPHRDSDMYITPGQFGSCLGSRYDPLVLNTDPNAADFRVPNLSLGDGLTVERLASRSELLSEFERRGRHVPTELSSDIDVNRAKALNLVTAPGVSRAFDLTAEPDEVRDRYGRHTWGQSHLLARRLVESGVRFVTTVNGPSITWDTHEDNFNGLRDRLVPPMQQAYVALLDDLDERGLLDSTLVVWMGDFGRTPVINGKAGRDHWPHCYSMVLAGGGVRGGQVIGQSDATGSVPRLRPVTPADLHATMFHVLGYDPQSITYHTADGRPTPLSEGHVIRELLG